ncbi:nicotinamide riboside transporter PnuC [Sphingobacterium griseoflavum]|uniref:Nicotinamide riboside transporter PnuC n=1 Tax=Sphingobacterium griseoflavum TaxID=1474952 RepID=A0ABQ3I023_9SPHI|nr:nicotinamide riboside transporter PnuC [Sphingobacterium griseoflavum]GHE43097.1 nucleoside transporter [Sphingobacterium griseoflavum]
MPELFTSFYQQFLSTSLLEWLATITGFMCVHLAARQNILNWPVSIVSVSIYAYLFYQNRLYGDAVLQLYFLFTAIYGWHYWGSADKKDLVPVTKLTNRQQLYIAILTLSLALLIGTILRYATNSDVPYMDGLCTAMSFVAQFLLTRRVLQNWLLWIVVNLLYIPLYLHKDLALTAILYVAFTIIAWNGYREWQHAYKQEKKHCA